MTAFERRLSEFPSDAVVVVGDVNSTLATALVAAKLQVPIAHVEAGLRSRDWSMPEEVNRALTDRLSAWLFTPSEDGDANLLAEGIEQDRIFMVGIVMIDTLLEHVAEARSRAPHLRESLELSENHAMLTLTDRATSTRWTSSCDCSEPSAKSGRSAPLCSPFIRGRGHNSQNAASHHRSTQSIRTGTSISSASCLLPASPPPTRVGSRKRPRTSASIV
jgi:hypothetical protein